MAHVSGNFAHGWNGVKFKANPLWNGDAVDRIIIKTNKGGKYEIETSYKR